MNEYEIQKIIKELTDKYGNFYTFEKKIRENSRTYIHIICKLHGKFIRRTDSKTCCKKCKHTKSYEDFVEISNEKHNNFYTYKKENYINLTTKMIITCPIHGEFKQSVSSHLRGTRCSECSGYKKKTTESFIKEANKKHNNFYTYDKTNYVGAHTKIIITCPTHGDFKQKPTSHIQGKGQGCGKCVGLHKTTKDFW